MTLFLRNKKNRTLVDIDIYVKTENKRSFIELNSSVIIDTYSDFLMNHLDNANEIIETFQGISELRGWLWETYFVGGENDPKELQNVIKEVTSFLKDVADKYELAFITD